MGRRAVGASGNVPQVSEGGVHRDVLGRHDETIGAVAVVGEGDRGRSAHRVDNGAVGDIAEGDGDVFTRMGRNGRNRHCGVITCTHGNIVRRCGGGSRNGLVGIGHGKGVGVAAAAQGARRSRIAAHGVAARVSQAEACRDTTCSINRANLGERIGKREASAVNAEAAAVVTIRGRTVGCHGDITACRTDTVNL